VFIGGLAVGAVGVGAVIVLIKRRNAHSTRRRLNSTHPAARGSRPASDFAGENPAALQQANSTGPRQPPPTAGAVLNPLGALPVSAAVSTHGGQLQHGGLARGREERASFAAVAAAWRPDAVGTLPHALPRVAETQVAGTGHA